MEKHFDSYQPLIVIIIFCILISVIQFGLSNIMYSFMGYFFIFLSLFKFFDLKGFVAGFATYDFITMRFRIYGYFYPFIEFLLGAAYLSQFNLLVVNLITLLLMLIGGISVLNSIYSGEKIKCACLGTTLSMPLSTVSVIENFGMGAMAAYKLAFYI